MPEGTIKRRARGSDILLVVLLTAALFLCAAVLHRYSSVLTKCDLPALCGFYRYTRLFCPACGMTRALCALTHFDIPLALRSNAFAVPLVITAAVSYAVFVANKVFLLGWRYPFPGRRPMRTLVVVACAFVLYTVLRNLPYAALVYLRPI